MTTSPLIIQRKPFHVAATVAVVVAATTVAWSRPPAPPCNKRPSQRHRLDQPRSRFSVSRVYCHDHRRGHCSTNPPHSWRVHQKRPIILNLRGQPRMPPPKSKWLLPNPRPLLSLVKVTKKTRQKNQPLSQHHQFRSLQKM